jgi:lauroyl/myristoyl acyltransferase
MLASLFLSGMQLLPASQRVRVVNKVSALLGWLLHAVNVHSTRTMRKNLNTVLGSDRSPDVVEADLRRLLSLTVWNALMINSLPVLSREQIVDLVPIDGISCLDGYLDDGRPVLIWSYHFGVHPLIVAAILHARGYPIHAIAHVRQMPVAASVFQRYYLQRLERIGDQFPAIDPREGVQREMLNVLRNKECLYVTPDYMIPADEIQPKSAFVVPIDFLGRRTWLQTGGLRLAKRLKAQVVTMLSTPGDGNGDERRLLVEPFELPTSGLKPVELQRDLQMCMRRLELHVLAHPYLWWDLKRDDLAKRLTTIPRDRSQP